MKRRKESEMLPLVKKYHDSDQSIQSFCAQHEISKSVFYYWSRKYREREGDFIALDMDQLGSVGCVDNPWVMEMITREGTVFRFSHLVAHPYVSKLKDL